MDGVLVHEDQLVPGADEFLAELRANETPFLVLTNNSIRTPRDLQARLRQTGLDIPEESIWTSALATATFLNEQRPNGTAYVVGESGLTTALHEIGYVLTEIEPDYVVLGETRNYSFEAITTAIRLVERGASFIATNPDPTGPSRDGSLPATGSVAALITRATGRDPYYIGKPNPLMMRSALRRLGAHSQSYYDEQRRYADLAAIYGRNDTPETPTEPVRPVAPETVAELGRTERKLTSVRSETPTRHRSGGHPTTFDRKAS
ncbi:HAD-IIA family hydrolase [Nocardia brasiliensis]|nr:HAD-IIA family hydrolase [Nocardia brasiliensis]